MVKIPFRYGNNIKKRLGQQHIIDPYVKKAIDWLKSTSFPNQGFHHPLDNCRLKSVSNALREFNALIEYESIVYYCHQNGILHEAAYKMIESFQKAKTPHFRRDYP